MKCTCSFCRGGQYVAVTYGSSIVHERVAPAPAPAQQRVPPGRYDAPAPVMRAITPGRYGLVLR